MPQAMAREYNVRLVINECAELYDYELSGTIEEEDFELLSALCHRPLNLNRADRYMLFDLPGMTYDLADRVVQYRAKNGQFKTVEDIMKVDGIGPSEYEVLLAFVSVEDDAEVVGIEDIPLMAELQLGSIGRLGTGRDADYAISSTKEFERLHQDYLRLKGTGLSYFGFGGLVTNRERTEAYYDRSIGRVVSDHGPASAWDLDKAYFSASYQAVSLVVGSYDVGFGKKLTFDTTGLSNPHGWRENRHFYTDLNKARLRPDNSLMGVALSVNGVDFDMGWLDATIFSSYQAHDIYQYYYRYQLDEYYESDGEACYYGFSDGEQTGCYSSRVYPADDPQGSAYSYVSFRDAYTELLAGANLTFNLSSRSRVGITGYRSETELVLAPEASPVFAWHSRLPRNNEFGSVGLNATWGAGDLEISGEYARTMAGGNGAYLEALIEEGTWLELLGGIRWYDRKYNNPYSRSPAAPTVTLGARQRNELGMELKAVIKPIRGLRSVTTLEGWRIPEFVTYDELSGKNQWRTLGQYDVRATQNLDWRITRKESVGMVAAYYDNDITRGGARETYSTPYDPADPADLAAMQYAVRGHGEKTKLEFEFSTKRFRTLSVSARYRVSWEDSKTKLSATSLEQSIKTKLNLGDSEFSLNEEFDLSDPDIYFSKIQQYANLRLTYRPSNALRIAVSAQKLLNSGGGNLLHASFYRGDDNALKEAVDAAVSEKVQGGLNGSDYGLALSSPEQKISLALWYNFSKRIKLHGLIGHVRYAGERSGRYPDYIIGKVDLTTRF